MASSSKTINMPLTFAISIGASVALVAITMFALAWYQYEKRVVLHDQVIVAPTHDEAYNKRLAEQEAQLGEIEKAMHEVAAQQGGHAGHAEQ